ncbi:MarR family transcriptional regulator [Plantactinospora mayteni]
MSKSSLIREVAAEIRLLQQSFDAFDEAAAARLRLNRTDLRALDIILGRQALTAGDLAAALGMSPAATTTVIDRLERAGFVVRTRDTGNRRRVMVEPTDTARAAERDVYLPVGTVGAKALRRYDENQLATILDFLRTARRVQQDQTVRLGSPAGTREEPPG